jgi:hypothetical protein
MSQKRLGRLVKSSIIKKGEFAGESVEYVITMCGKKGVLKLLKYYNLDKKILEEFHLHKLSPKEKRKREKENLEKGMREQKTQEQVCQSVSVLEEEIYETTATLIEEEEYLDPYENNWDSVMYDPEDDPMDSSFYYPSVMDWTPYSYGGGVLRKTRNATS